MMGCWGARRGTIAMLAAAALVTGCSGHRPGTPRKDYAEIADELNHGAGQAVADGFAQEVLPPSTPPAARRQTRRLGPGEPIWIQTGKSLVLEVAHPVRRVSIGDPDLAGIVILGPRTIMLNAKQLPEPRGADAGGRVASGRAAIVTGRTLTPEPRLAETTFTIWDGEESPDVHSMIVADFIDQQVMLEVTVAEINRTAAEQHGIDFRAMRDSFISAFFMGGGAGPSALGGGQMVPPGAGGILPLGTTSSKPNFAFVLPQQDITGFIEALQTEGLATVLAQPKIVAMSGQNAVFQVGGEIPIRVATGFSTDIEFKPFGTIVNFIARVAEEGDIVLTVTPEVSQPDFNALVEGIPTFRTRRASTATRLRDGQTLVIGGLLQTTRREEVAGVPYLKDIPFVGYVFRTSIYFDETTELLVVVTPRLVRPLPPGEMVHLPTERGPLTNEEIRTKPHPAGASRPRVPGVP
jgi:pilus assembly protein CpaC